MLVKETIYIDNGNGNGEEIWQNCLTFYACETRVGRLHMYMYIVMYYTPLNKYCILNAYSYVNTFEQIS